MPKLLLLLPLLLLLVAKAAGDDSLQQERLSWLIVTKPHARNVILSCVSQHFYPFRLLYNDSDTMGNGTILRLWWLLPDRTTLNASQQRGNLRVASNGAELHVSEVTQDTYGLYHCSAEAYAPDGNVTLYFYKRGLNLYGAKIYDSAWDQYKGNLLTGCLSAGSFLALLAGWVLLQRLGICQRLSSSAVHSFEVDEEAPAANGGGGGGGGDGVTAEGEELAASQASLKQRQAAKSQEAETAA